MQRQLNGQTIRLIPIQTFRAQYELPVSFGVNHFEPKDTTGLARLDEAGDALAQLKKRVVSSVPERVVLPGLLSLMDTLQAHFECELRAINSRVGLGEPEIGFAVAGFGDVLRTWVYQVIAWQTGHAAAPEFETVYQSWLNSSTRLSQRPHTYTQQGRQWIVHILNDAYGRIGLRVELPGQVVYVQDTALACPAAGFMFRLLQSCAARIHANLA